MGASALLLENMSGRTLCPSQWCPEQALLGWVEGTGIYVVRYRPRPRPVLLELADPSLTEETGEEGDFWSLGCPARLWLMCLGLVWVGEGVS